MVHKKCQAQGFPSEELTLPKKQVNDILPIMNLVKSKNFEFLMNIEDLKGFG